MLKEKQEPTTHQSTLGLKCSRPGSLLTLGQPAHLMAAGHLFSHCGVTLVERSVSAPTKCREDWRMVRRLVGVGNSSLIGKAKAACPSKMETGTDSQLPISMQVSNQLPESRPSACTCLKKWKVNSIATNVLLPPSCSSFYGRVPCQMAENSPLASWVSCPAQGNQPVSLLVLTSLYGKPGLGVGSLDLPVRCNRHLCSLCWLLQPSHCNPAIAASQQLNLLF